MTDSPRVFAPLDPTEKPLLDQLLQLRTKLELLKADKSQYVKAEDVNPLWEQLLGLVHELNDLRTDKRGEQNRVDTVLDDCFQLISLAFMTMGKNTEAPAIYSHVSTIKRLLDHLEQAAFFSEKDLITISANLEEYRGLIDKHREDGDPHFITLLSARIDICQSILSRLQAIVEHLTPELKPYWEKLVSILRLLSAANVRSTFPKDEVEDYQRQLREMQAELKLRNMEPVTGSDLRARYADQMKAVSYIQNASAEELVTDLLTRNTLWAEIILDKPGEIEPEFKDVYDRLQTIRNTLESKSLLQAWSCRETDLYDFQRRLDRIDESRLPDGNFGNTEGKTADIQTQRTLLFLLRKSYALIYAMISSSEPVSEALLPIFNQLKTLKKCLREVQKAGGLSSPRELWPYSMKLSSIDNMKVDGKFMVGGEIPEGQAALTGLMEDCFEIVYQLRQQAEEASNEEEVVEEKSSVKQLGEGIAAL